MTPEEFGQFSDGLEQMLEIAKGISAKVVEYRDAMVRDGMPPQIADAMAQQFGIGLISLMQRGA